MNSGYFHQIHSRVAPSSRRKSTKKESRRRQTKKTTTTERRRKSRSRTPAVKRRGEGNRTRGFRRRHKDKTKTVPLAQQTNAVPSLLFPPTASTFAVFLVALFSIYLPHFYGGVASAVNITDVFAETPTPKDVMSFFVIFLLLLFIRDMYDIKYPEPYYVFKTGRNEKEIRPMHSVIGHVLVFRWLRPILGDGRLFQKILVRLNEGCMTWDSTFEERGENANEWVLSFCELWGIPIDPWIWKKTPGAFRTPNEFFGRRFHPDHTPPIGDAEIVSPATAVVTWFESARDLPKTLKNDQWALDDSIGVPRHERFVNNAAAILYLAPQDYHRFHVPIDGVLECVQLLNQDKYSVTVKSYIFNTVCILTRNRRAVVVVRGTNVRVAIIVVGGVTVDSIRLESGIEEGKRVRKGQMLGTFARGGSSIVMLFDGNVDGGESEAEEDRALKGDVRRRKTADGDVVLERQCSNSVVVRCVDEIIRAGERGARRERGEIFTDEGDEETLRKRSQGRDRRHPLPGPPRSFQTRVKTFWRWVISKTRKRVDAIDVKVSVLQSLARVTTVAEAASR